MSDEETQSVETEVSTADASATNSETEQPERQESAADRKKRNDQEYNWAEARRKMQELERQNQEFKQQFDKLNKPAVPEVDEIDQLGDQDLVTKAHVKKMAEKMARQIAEQVVRQREDSTVDERLAAKFPDFAEVVSKENIELLKQTEPELAMSLSHNPDAFAQGVSVYKLLKKIGGTPQMNADKEKAKKNSEKPVSVNAVTKASALGNAHLFENGLTKDVKNQLWAEMQEIRKRA